MAYFFAVDWRKNSPSLTLLKDDQFIIDLNYYNNLIKNYITYGPASYMDSIVESNGVREPRYNSKVASVNNLNDFKKHGLELNSSYSHPLFYVHGNLTIPFRHDNKICSWESPHGRGNVSVYNPDGSTTITEDGKGERLCYSSWSWIETGTIEPTRGNLTVAVTPMDRKLEIVGTVHYKGKQRAAYWYDKSLGNGQSEQDASYESLPDAGFLNVPF